ncbi:MAG: hypothetical protein QOE21_1546 [Microbacteriaceae bacterium]|jgi:hypothetical protein|nr:hypothetical protein [Microbacteriaceae bacterium]
MPMHEDAERDMKACLAKLGELWLRKAVPQ